MDVTMEEVIEMEVRSEEHFEYGTEGHRNGHKE